MSGTSTGSTWATQPVDALGRYTLRQQLGAGGMGVVHLATDPAGRAVALKELPAHIAADEGARARLRREFTSLQRIEHPRVAPVLDADLDGPRPYLVTRYIPGLSLEQRVFDGGPLERAELSRLGVGLAEALEAIHSAGVVHRDLKPTNVLMLDADPVVIDFGIAQASDDVRLTQVGVVMGTPGYLAPEVLDGAAATPGVDWWAWAATLTFAATARPPFGRGPLDAVLGRVHRGEPDLAGVDPALAGLLRAALTPDLEQRPAPARLVEGLRDWEAGRLPAPAPRHAPAEPQGRVQGADPTEALPARSAGREGEGPAATATLPVAGSATAASDPSPTQAYSRLSTRVMPAVSRESFRRGEHGDEGGYGRRAEGVGYGDHGAVREARVPYAGFGAAPAGRPPAGREPAAPAAPQAPADPQPRGGATAPAPRRRASMTFPLLGLLALFVALGASWPVVAVCAAVVWSALARTVYASMRGVEERRFDRGPRRSDGFVAVLLSPVRLVPATLTALLSVLGCLVVAVAAMFGTSALVSMTSGLRADPFSEIALAAGMTVGALVGWWGIGGTALRRGSRAMVRVVSPGRAGPILVGTVLLAAAATLAIRLQGTGVVPDWAPLADVISGTLISWF